MGYAFAKRIIWVIIIGLVIFCLVIIRKEGSRAKHFRQLLPTSGMAAIVRSNISAQELTQKQLLIVTYMRSGSSLTGDIMQQADNTFYVYEPVHTVEQIVKTGIPLVSLLGEVRQPPFDMETETIDVIRNWFKCDIERIPKLSVLDGFMGIGPQTRMFPRCLAKEHATPEGFRICTKRLQNVCLNASLIVLKTIRVHFQSVKYLFEEFPNLQIIHLVRDPRATLLSQKQMGMCSEQRGGNFGCANKFCSRLENNVPLFDDIAVLFPGRIITVRYEDLAYHPIEVSRKLYEFVGTTFTRKVEKYVYNITMAGKPDDCTICTTRSNSSRHVDAWKFIISDHFLNIIQNRCGFIMEKFQYKHITSKEREDLRMKKLFGIM